MKFLITTLITITFSALLISQEDYTKSLNGIDWIKVESKADVIVKTHSKSELLIKSLGDYKAPERAKGLKLVGDGGSDNTDVGFYVVQDGTDLIVKNLRNWSKGKAEIYVPTSQNISITTTGAGQGDINIHGVNGEIEANARLNGEIQIESVGGPVTANSLNGNVDVTFTQVNQSSPITIYSTNGAVDIKLPQSTPADLNMGSTNGEIYTDFEIKFPEKDGLKSIYNRNVKQEINGGGVLLKLKTTNGNIYLRKN